MKLEVGMYVRNDYFGIGKIDKDYFDSNNKHWFNVQFNCYGDDDCHCGICEQSIGYKTSHNIIDLIQEGDILKINDYKDIYTICEVEKFKNPYFPLEKFLGVRHNNKTKKLYEIPLINLKILTKEQFESMSYKVGE